MKNTSSALALVVFLLGAAVAQAEWELVDPAKLPPPAAGQIDFVKHIQPILENRCLRCHWPSPNRLKDDARFPDAPWFYVHARGAFMRGGRSGPPMIPGKSAESLMIHLLSGPDPLIPQMPPAPNVTSRLHNEEIGKLRAWIDQGVVWPDGVVLPLPPREEP
jgi:hypothetical protein